MRSNATASPMRARAVGVPLTLAACGAAIACSFVFFSVAWRRHLAMYPVDAVQLHDSSRGFGSAKAKFVSLVAERAQQHEGAEPPS